jgi:hypothetical protein
MLITTTQDFNRIFDFLYQSMASDGGDGFVLWYSRFLTLKEILPYLQEYNKQLESPMQIELFENHISWSQDQEGVIIVDTHQESINHSAYDVFLKL